MTRSRPSSPSRRPPLGCTAAVLATLTLASAADWPRYRGPLGDGVATESIARAWPAEGPKPVWKVPTPDGFSSFAVAGRRAFTLVKRSLEGVDREVCVALEAATGKELWATPVGIAKYDKGGDTGTASNRGGDGPRSTPTVDGAQVYTFSAHLVLTCLEAATGQVVWTRDLIKEHAGRNIPWQSAASPVIEGDLVFVGGGGPGESLLGLHKKDGRVVWKGQDETLTHSTPTLASLHGLRQVIFFTRSGLVSVAPADGRVLWRHAFPFKTATAVSPVVGGDIVYCGAGYGVGSAAVRVSKEGSELKATELWRVEGNANVPNHWSTPVCIDGYLYGMFSHTGYGDGPLKCVELATGKVAWEQKGFGRGNVILSGRHLVALSDAGELVLVEAKPSAYAEVARAKVLGGKCWSTPALTGGRLYLRSTTEGVCLDVSGLLATR